MKKEFNTKKLSSNLEKLAKTIKRFSVSDLNFVQRDYSELLKLIKNQKKA